LPEGKTCSRPEADGSPVTLSLQDEGINPAAAAAVHCVLKDMNPPHLLISALGNICT